MVGASEKEKGNEREKDVPSAKPLRNFRMPFRLKWRQQKQLSCINVAPTDSNPGNFNSTARPLVDHHLKKSLVAAAPCKNVITKTPVSTSTPVVGDATGILEDKRKDSNNNEKKPLEKELRRRILLPRAPSGRALNEGGGNERGLKSLLASDKGERSGSGDQQLPRFSLTLSKEEIEIDFLLMTGAMPPRKPNRRRTEPVQKQFETLFPGSLLTEVGS